MGVKGIVFTISTFLLFSLVLELGMLVSLVNSSSNKIITRTIISDKMVGVHDNLLTNLEGAVNAEWSSETTSEGQAVRVSTRFNDYNATKELVVFEKWVNEHFNNQTSIGVKANTSRLREAIRDGELTTFFEPIGVEWINKYSQDRLTSVELRGENATSTSINATGCGEVLNVSWAGNQPSPGGFNFSLTLPNYNESWMLDERNYEVSVKTTSGQINISLGLSGENAVLINAPPSTSLVTIFKVVGSNIFKVSYPYNSTVLNLTSQYFGLSVLNEGVLT